VVAANLSDGRVDHGWAGESEPLESETACLAPPGSLKLALGFERETASRRRESQLPFALDYAVHRRVELVVEPIVYSHVRQPDGSLASGLGDLELTAVFLAIPESRRIPGVAFAAEVNLPTARSRVLGSGKADWTGDLILSKRFSSFDTHCNLTYTILGPPAGVLTQDVYGFSLAVERRVASFDVVAEVIGHTRTLGSGGDPDASDASREAAPDLVGEELVGTLGGRYHLNERLVLSMSVGYDNDHALRIDPGLSVKLR
jgi:hypothetical protein